MDTKSKIYKTIAEVFEIEETAIKDDMTSNDIEKWDSLQQLNLIMALENKFAIRLTTDEIFEISTIGSIINIISSKINHK